MSEIVIVIIVKELNICILRDLELVFIAMKHHNLIVETLKSCNYEI